MSGLGGLARGVVAASVALGLGYLAQYAFTLAGSLGFAPEAAGRLFFAISLAHFAGLLGRTGLDRLVVKRVAVLVGGGSPAAAHTVAVAFMRRILLQSLAACAVVAGLALTGWGPVPPAPLALGAATLGNAAAMGVAGLLKGVKRAGWSAGVQNALPFGVGAVVVLASRPFSPDPVPAGLWAVAGGSVAAAALGWAVFTRALRAVPGRADADVLSADELAAQFQGQHAFTAMAMLAFFSSGVAGLDVLIVGVFADPGVVGIYVLASRTVLLMALGLNAVNIILGPMIAEAASKKAWPEAQALVTAAARWSLAFAMLAGGLILASASTLLQERLPEQIVAALPALYVLMIGQLMNAATGPVSMVMQMIGDERRAAAQFAAVLAVMIPFYGFGSHALGALGAALVTASGRSAQWLWMTHSTRARHGLGCDVLGDLGRHAWILVFLGVAGWWNPWGTAGAGLLALALCAYVTMAVLSPWDRRHLLGALSGKSR